MDIKENEHKGTSRIDSQNYDDSDLTICPRCSDRLEPMFLDSFKEDNILYQRIWWTCRGLNFKTCVFPLDMPSNIYWTKRSIEQKNQGIIPLPNIHLLSEEYHHLYPKVFETKAMAEATRIEQPIEKASKKRRYKKEVVALNSSNPANEDVETLMELDPVPSTSKINAIESQSPTAFINFDKSKNILDKRIEIDDNRNRNLVDEVYEKESQLDAALGRYHDVIRKSKRQQKNRKTDISASFHTIDNLHKERWAQQVEEVKDAAKHQKPNFMEQQLNETHFMTDTIQHVNPLINPSEEDEIERSPMQFNEEGNRQKISLFPCGQVALNSILSLQYSGDQFLNKVNSEMSRKQMIRPPSAMTQKQRCKMSTILNHSSQPDPLLLAITSPLVRKVHHEKQITTPEKLTENFIDNSASSIPLPDSSANSVSDAVDGLLALNSNANTQEISSRVGIPPPLQENIAPNTPKALGVQTSTVVSAMRHIEAYSRTQELEKRLGHSVIKKDYQKRVPNMSISTQNYFEGALNSSGSSKGSSASSSFGQNSSKKESSTKKLIRDPDDDPELNMLLKRKMKKIVKQNKELFSRKVDHPLEGKETIMTDHETNPPQLEESSLEGPSMKFVDEYGFSVDHAVLFRDPNRADTPDRLTYINEYEFLNHRYNTEEMTLDDALLL